MSTAEKVMKKYCFNYLSTIFNNMFFKVLRQLENEASILRNQVAAQYSKAVNPLPLNSGIYYETNQIGFSSRPVFEPPQYANSFPRSHLVTSNPILNALQDHFPNPIQTYPSIMNTQLYGLHGSAPALTLPQVYGQMMGNQYPIHRIQPNYITNSFPMYSQNPQSNFHLGFGTIQNNCFTGNEEINSFPDYA